MTETCVALVMLCKAIMPGNPLASPCQMAALAAVVLRRYETEMHDFTANLNHTTMAVVGAWARKETMSNIQPHTKHMMI
jgi:hypothetical protein